MTLKDGRSLWDALSEEGVNQLREELAVTKSDRDECRASLDSLGIEIERLRLLLCSTLRYGSRPVRRAPLGSPDFSTCVHCGEAIGWDDYSYTHMSNGFATCGTLVVGGKKPRGSIGRLMRDLGLHGTFDPEIRQDPNVTTCAEPVEWYE